MWALQYWLKHAFHCHIALQSSDHTRKYYQLLRKLSHNRTRNTGKLTRNAVASQALNQFRPNQSLPQPSSLDTLYVISFWRFQVSTSKFCERFLLPLVTSNAQHNITLTSTNLFWIILKNSVHVSKEIRFLYVIKTSWLMQLRGKIILYSENHMVRHTYTLWAKGKSS
jgi:hypothetical protein